MEQPNQDQGLEIGRPAAAPREGSDIAVIADYLSRRPLLSLSPLLDELERRIIIEVLNRTLGNQRAAAARLGLKYTTFVEKVKRHGIEIERQVRLVVQ
jgi:transcriptional regulator with GAF, ATPase, and Fis domain